MTRNSQYENNLEDIQTVVNFRKPFFKTVRTIENVTEVQFAGIYAAYLIDLKLIYLYAFALINSLNDSKFKFSSSTIRTVLKTC